MSRMSFMDALHREMKVALLRGRVPATTGTAATTEEQGDSYHMYICTGSLMVSAMYTVTYV